MVTRRVTPKNLQEEQLNRVNGRQDPFPPSELDSLARRLKMPIVELSNPLLLELPKNLRDT
jgi:hypothetical protein